MVLLTSDEKKYWENKIAYLENNRDTLMNFYLTGKIFILKFVEPQNGENGGFTMNEKDNLKEENAKAMIKEISEFHYTVINYDQYNKIEPFNASSVKDITLNYKFIANTKYNGGGMAPKYIEGVDPNRTVTDEKWFHPDNLYEPLSIEDYDWVLGDFIHRYRYLAPCYYSDDKLHCDWKDPTYQWSFSSSQMSGWTLLHVACYFTKPEIVLELLKNGADPNIKNDKGLTPLWVMFLDTSNKSRNICQGKAGLWSGGKALFRLDFYNIINYLLDFGADPNIPVSTGGDGIGLTSDLRLLQRELDVDHITLIDFFKNHFFHPYKCSTGGRWSYGYAREFLHNNWFSRPPNGKKLIELIEEPIRLTEEYNKEHPGLDSIPLNIPRPEISYLPEYFAEKKLLEWRLEKVKKYIKIRQNKIKNNITPDPEQLDRLKNLREAKKSLENILIKFKSGEERRKARQEALAKEERERQEALAKEEREREKMEAIDEKAIIELGKKLNEKMKNNNVDLSGFPAFQCSICLAPFKIYPKQKISKLLSCQHVFHTECIEGLMAAGNNTWNKRCPVCRVPIKGIKELIEAKQVNFRGAVWKGGGQTYGIFHLDNKIQLKF